MGSLSWRPLHRTAHPRAVLAVPTAGPSSPESDRLRTVGIIILVLGIIGASIFYYVEARAARPTIEELLPDYAHSQAQQIGVLMGNFGVLLLGWSQVLNRPGPEALIIAAVSALVASGFFRAAHVRDYNDRVHAQTGDDNPTGGGGRAD